MKKENRSSGHEDLRQRRTKRHLTGALLELLEERPFGEISVVDICERAMVHRTTFYAHFEDKAALLRYTAESLQERFEEEKGRVVPACDPKAYFLALFQYALDFIRAHRGLYLTSVGADGIEQRMLEEVVAERLTAQLSEPGFLDVDGAFVPELAAHFYAGAILSLIRWYLEQEHPVSNRVLLLHLEHFIPSADAGAGRAE